MSEKRRKQADRTQADTDALRKAEQAEDLLDAQLAAWNAQAAANGGDLPYENERVVDNA